MKLEYTNIEYVKGIIETYKYAFIQKGYNSTPDIYLYNGEITGNTISKQTLEKLISK